jgi:putative oxidoreductase
MRFLDRFEEPAYALLRIVGGFLFLQHGLQKAGFFGGPVASAPLSQAAMVIELAVGVLVAIGLFTRPAAFLASGEMAVAYFLRHAPQGFWPLRNKGEAAVFFCFLFLYIAARGAGRWGLDSRLGRRRLLGPRRVV